MIKVFVVHIFLLFPILIRGQEMTHDTLKTKRKFNYGISGGIMLYPLYSRSELPYFLGYSTGNGIAITNLFYEPGYEPGAFEISIIPTVDIFFNKAECFYQLIGLSYSFNNFYYYNGKRREDVVNYHGIYLSYQNQLLSGKYIKIPVIKNIYVGGRFVLSGKNIVDHITIDSEWPLPDYNVVAVEKNAMMALSFSFGYKKAWKKLNIDIGLSNMPAFATAWAEYSPTMLVNEPTGSYFVYITPFGSKLIDYTMDKKFKFREEEDRDLSRVYRPDTFILKVGYVFSKKQ